MTRSSFNVLTEPWIPVIKSDGTEDELGILPCLEQCREIWEIRDPAPIIEFGLYRLLIAFVLDALIDADVTLESPDDLEDILNQGNFGIDLQKYAASCGDVFDLFHPERPFLQTKMDSVKSVKALATLFPATPSGSNSIFWNHAHENEISVSSAFAARLLTTMAPFMTAGGRGLVSTINDPSSLYVLPIGESLFETVVYNLPVPIEPAIGRGVPWRNSPVGINTTRPHYLEAFTWRPRLIQLVPEKTQDRLVVSSMQFANGDSAVSWEDPNVAYYYSERKPFPFLFQDNRHIWRDAAPLLFLEDQRQGTGKKMWSLDVLGF